MKQATRSKGIIDTHVHLNEIDDVAGVLTAAAEIKDLPVDELTRITTANAEDFFGI